MLAETYIALDRFLVAELNLDAQEPVADSDGTFVTWQGDTPYGPVRFDLVLAPAYDQLTLTLFDDDIEQELDRLSSPRPDAAWAVDALARIARRLEANV